MGDETPAHPNFGRPWAAVAACASRQHHLVTTEQLHAAGLGPLQIHYACAVGRLHPVHHGVYAVGAPVTGDLGRWMAATLAGGGVLSDRSASSLWGFWIAERSDEHVIVQRTANHEHRGVRVHRPRRFDPLLDATRRHGIPLTTPARTLLDLAASTSASQLTEALTGARVARCVRDDDLRDVLARSPAHRGARRLGLALTGPFTRSKLERRFLRLCADHDLPTPLANAPFAGEEVDLLFVAERVAVELDGKQHAGQWAKDARKDAVLRAAGLVVLRLTWWDVHNDARRTAARVRAVLGRRKTG